MWHKFSLVLSFYICFFTGWLPDSPAVMRFRGWLYRPLLKSCGSDFQVARNVVLRGLGNIAIGDNVYIGPNSIFLIRKGCTVGDKVLIGPNCVIVDSNHGFDGESFRFSRGRSSEIHIGDGSWISANVVLTQGAKIPRKSVVPANSRVGWETAERGSSVG